MGCNGTILGHFKFAAWLLKMNTFKKFHNFKKSLTALNYSKIEDIELDGIDTRDYPDFCDAYIASATYKGREMTEQELERLNDDRGFVYECVLERLF
jgi:hypothetical protein